MINIKAKKEKNGIITHLKSEYGNVFSRETVIETIKSGYRYLTFSSESKYDQIYVVENEKGTFLSTNGQMSLDRQKISKDEIGNIPSF